MLVDDSFKVFADTELTKELLFKQLSLLLPLLSFFIVSPFPLFLREFYLFDVAWKPSLLLFFAVAVGLALAFVVDTFLPPAFLLDTVESYC